MKFSGRGSHDRDWSLASKMLVVVNLRRTNRLGYTDIFWRIILICILEKEFIRVWAEF
jgi:hypothetical protein